MDDTQLLKETSYRKGYYHGYERALLDMQAMIKSCSVSKPVRQS